MTFSGGLDADKVHKGAPIWARQARRQRMAAAAAIRYDSACAGEGDLERIMEDLPPAPRVPGGRVTMPKTSEPERMQVV